MLLKIAAVAGGITLTLCIAAACVFWYVTKPKPSKPWNATALTSSEAPGIIVYGKELHIHLRYVVQNHTERDYSISKYSSVRVMGKLTDGSLTAPMQDDTVSVEDTVFIPARQTGTITLETKSIGLVAQRADQTDEQYHEQARDLLNKMLGGLDGFTIFDDADRYQINLPRWLATKPTPPKPEGKPPKT